MTSFHTYVLFYMIGIVYCLNLVVVLVKGVVLSQVRARHPKRFLEGGQLRSGRDDPSIHWSLITV